MDNKARAGEGARIIRPAGLADVPAMVRLFHQPDRPGLHAPRDTDHAAALRLLLAHHALDEESAWVAAARPAQLTAVAVWLRPGVHRDIDAFRSVVARELELPAEALDMGRADGEVLRATMARTGQWTVLVASRPTYGTRQLAGLLAPGMRGVDQRDESVAVLSTSEEERDALAPLGTGDAREVPLPSGARLWLTTLTGPTAESRGAL